MEKKNMPRVTIRYTADLEEVPSITSGLFEDSIEAVKLAAELLEKCARDAENKTRTEQVMLAVEEARQNLIKADQSIQDATDLLSGYESAKRSLEEDSKRPERPPAPPAPATEEEEAE